VSLLWAWFWFGAAAAEPLSAQVSQIEASLEAGDYQDAGRKIQLTMSAAPYSADVADAQAVSELLYLQGLLPRMMGAERESDLDLWRDAIVIYPDIEWSTALLNDRDQAAVFEALRGEVFQRPGVATGVPEKHGLAQAYVDGVEHQHDQAVRAGRHLVQVVCPGGKTVGRWTRFQEPVPWLTMCPEPIDLTVSPPEAAEEDDGFGPDVDPRAGPEPLPLSSVPKPPKISFSKRWKTKLLVGAGSSVLLSGGLYAAALSGRAEYDDLDAAGVSNSADLEALRASTNQKVTVSLTLAGVGVGMATVAGFSGRW
jgi:hypothetical protein